MNISTWSVWPSRLRVAMLRTLGVEIGPGALIAQGVFIGSSQVRIGARALIGMDCFIDGSAPVEIGEAATLGPFCRIISGTHRIMPGVNRRGTEQTLPRPVKIGIGSWLGANVLLVCASVGDSTVVGAGTVVDRDVGPNELIKGARIVERSALPTR